MTLTFDLKSHFHPFFDKKIAYNLKNTGHIFMQFYTAVYLSSSFYNYKSNNSGRI